MRSGKKHPVPFLKGKKHDQIPKEDVRFSWQTDGYHMERSKLDEEEGVTDSNDNGYQVVGYSSSAPNWMDPFNDRAVDPSLVKERSLELMDHRGMFWENSRDSYAPVGAVSMEAAPPAPWYRTALEKIRTLEFSQVLRPLTLFLAMVLFLVVMRYLVLDIRTVSVVGVSRVSPAEVIELSGIQKGMSILNMNEKAIAERIETNPYLRFGYLENIGTHEVAIHVRERRGEVYAKLRGVIYVMDGQGMILEEEINAMPGAEDAEGQKRIREMTEGRIQVLLGNVGKCTVGRKVKVDALTLSAMEEILLELRAMSMEDYVEEITLSNIGSISMTTRDGYSVRFGDYRRVHAKLRVMRLVADRLKEDNRRGGTIDVEIPETPTWIPDTL